MGLNIDKYQDGEFLDATDLQKLGEAAMKKIIAGANIVVTESPEAWVISSVLPDEFWGKITGGANPYDFVEQVPVTGGGWVDGERASTSTAKAFEANSSATVTVGTIVWMRRHGGRWVFQLTLC